MNVLYNFGENIFILEPSVAFGGTGIRKSKLLLKIFIARNCKKAGIIEKDIIGEMRCEESEGLSQYLETLEKKGTLKSVCFDDGRFRGFAVNIEELFKGDYHNR